LKYERPDPLYSRIVGQIRTLIQRGELSPGDRLLSERRLAEQLGVGRNSLREALALLVGMGFLKVAPRGGIYVRNAGLDGAVELLTSHFLQERQDIYHLLEARDIVETAAARLAAERAAPADLERIRLAMEDVAADVAARRAADISDTRFHRLIADAAHNPVLQSLMSILSSLMEKEYGPVRRRFLNDPHRAPRFLAQHRAILHALRRRDGEAAARAMRAHITFAVESLFQLNRRVLAPVGRVGESRRAGIKARRER